MNGILIAYRLRTPHDPNVASALVKRLYGQNTSSQGGKYRYRRKGLLAGCLKNNFSRYLKVLKITNTRN